MISFHGDATDDLFAGFASLLYWGLIGVTLTTTVSATLFTLWMAALLVAISDVEAAVDDGQ